MSLIDTHSLIWWIVRLQGPNSTISAPKGAIKRASEVPPVVETVEDKPVIFFITDRQALRH